MRRIGMLAAGFGAGAAIVGLVATSAFAGGVTSYATVRPASDVVAAQVARVPARPVTAARVPAKTPAITASPARLIPAASPAAIVPVTTRPAGAATARPSAAVIPSVSLATASRPASTVIPAVVVVTPPPISCAPSVCILPDPATIVYVPVSANNASAYCLLVPLSLAQAYTGGSDPGTSIRAACPSGVPQLGECTAVAGSKILQVAPGPANSGGLATVEASTVDVGRTVTGVLVPSGTKIVSLGGLVPGPGSATMQVNLNAAATVSGSDLCGIVSP
jgi:hypothetical protein